MQVLTIISRLSSGVKVLMYIIDTVAANRLLTYRRQTGQHLVPDEVFPECVEQFIDRLLRGI